MSAPTDLGAVFDPGRPLTVTDRPLQFPGRPTLLRRAALAGPETAGDRRVLLDRETLRRCLAAAEASPLGRAQIDRVGLIVELYRDASGHEFEVWTLSGLAPRPEALPAVLGG